MIDSQEFFNLQLEKAALLYCEGMAAEAIADELGTGKDEAGRLIEYAEQRGFIDYAPRFNHERMTGDVAEFAANTLLSRGLRDALTDTIEAGIVKISVSPSPRAMFREFRNDPATNANSLDTYDRVEQQSLAVVAARAAQALSARLCDGADHVVGLNWGTSVKHVVRKVRPIVDDRALGKITVLSLFGDPEFQASEAVLANLHSAHVDCNALVCEFAKRFGRRAKAMPLNVPCFIPAYLATDPVAFENLRRFLGSHLSYRRIFGELPEGGPERPRRYNGIINGFANAKLTQMDTVLTSFGAADAHTWSQHYLEFWLSETELSELRQYSHDGKIVGDLAGHFVTSAEATDDDEVRQFIRRVNQRALAAQPADFVDVACRYRKDGKGAGVVGVAVGARKAKVIARLLGWSPCPISALFLDSHCALALLALLNADRLARLRGDGGTQFWEGSDHWSDDTKAAIPLAA